MWGEKEVANAGLAASPPAVAVAVPVLIGGCPRSGTTLLGAMLGASSEALVVPESTFKFRTLPLAAGGGVIDRARLQLQLTGDPLFKLWGVSPTTGRSSSVLFSEWLNELVAAYGEHLGAGSFRWWIDHTPRNIAHAHALAELVPDAKFVNLVRDGRAVAASIRPADWGPNTIPAAARLWSQYVALGLAAERSLGPARVMTVRFEDLVEEPETVLESVCRFLGMQFDASMITERGFAVGPYTAAIHQRVADPPDASRAGAWRRELTHREIQWFEAETADLLPLLGYERTVGPAACQAPKPARMIAAAGDLARRATTDRWRRRRRRKAAGLPGAPRRTIG